MVPKCWRAWSLRALHVYEFVGVSLISAAGALTVLIVSVRFDVSATVWGAASVYEITLLCVWALVACLSGLVAHLYCSSHSFYWATAFVRINRARLVLLCALALAMMLRHDKCTFSFQPLCAFNAALLAEAVSALLALYVEPATSSSQLHLSRSEGEDSCMPPDTRRISVSQTTITTPSKRPESVVLQVMS